MARRCILHIGTEKTGTTTIQRMLNKRRAAFARQGVQALRPPLPRRLVAASVSRERAGPLHRDFGVTSPEGFAAFRTTVGAELRDALEGAAGTVIVSSEHCHGALQSDEGIGALKALLDAHFDDIVVVVYLRRQVDLAVSLYSTHIASGHSRPSVLPDVQPSSDYFNYESLLDRWARWFGADHMRPRLFERSHLVDGDLLRDFVHTCGLQWDGDLDGFAPENQSVLPGAQELLRLMNPHIPRHVDGRQNPQRGPLVQYLRECYPGPGRMPTRAQGRGFQQSFDESNEGVRQRWFSSVQAPLFSESFDKFPELPAAALTVEELVEVTCALWERARGGQLELEAELRVRDAKDARKRGDDVVAMQCTVDALELNPAHVAAWAMLASLHRSAGDLEAAQAAIARAVSLAPHREGIQAMKRRIDSSAAKLQRNDEPT